MNIEYYLMNRMIELSMLLFVLKLYKIINWNYFYIILPAILIPAIFIVLIVIAMGSMILKSTLNKILYD